MELTEVQTGHIFDRETVNKWIFREQISIVLIDLSDVNYFSKNEVIFSKRFLVELHRKSYLFSVWW